MRFQNFSIIALLLIGTTAWSAGIPKAPQSAIVPTDAKSAAEKPAKNASDLAKAKPISLGSVTTEVEGDLTIITARLSEKPEWKDLSMEEHGTFLQIKLPGTQIPASGEFMDGNGPFLRKIASFQLPEEDGALRLFVNQDASKAKLATTAELLGDRIVITIDHKKLDQLIAPQPKVDTTPTAEEIISKTTVDTSAPAPSQILAKENATVAAKQEDNQSGLHSELTKVAAFCAALLVMLLGVHFLRLKRKRGFLDSGRGDHVQPVSMKVLSSISVGQKQKLTLVQVGNQQILLGVGPESINLITAIDNNTRPQTFAGALHAANPDAEIRLKAPEEIAAPKAARRALTSTTSSASRAESSVKGSRVNVAIGEDGARSIASHSAKKEDDITRLLRDRLRNLPPG